MQEKIIKGPHNERFDLFDWCSHIPMLVTVLTRTQPKTILELGPGNYSTTILNAYCQGNPEVRCVSLENSVEWINKLSWMALPNHEIRKIDQWVYDDLAGPWDFVFIDQAPEPERIPALRFFRDHQAGVVLLHDCNYPERYGEILSGFKYVVHDHRHRFQTAVASSIHDVTKWFEKR